MTQHMDALAVANRVRLARVTTMRWIAEPKNYAESVERACEVLQDPPPHMGSVGVHRFLSGIYQYGGNRARRVLALEMIGEHRTLGELTVRQAARIASALHEGAYVETRKAAA